MKTRVDAVVRTVSELDRLIQWLADKQIPVATAIIFKGSTLKGDKNPILNCCTTLHIL